MAVLVGAKVFFEEVAKQPVAMSDLPSPMSDSQECADLLEDLPNRVAGHSRADIAEPAPPGAAAWASTTLERVTLRCGVDLPMQYDEYSQPVEIEGVEWLQVSDATPESTLATWYSVDRSPVVAVTADDTTLGTTDNPVAELGEAIAELDTVQHEPNPAPLSQLAAGDTNVCGDLMQNLPEELAEDYSRFAISDPFTAVWTAQGREAIMLRCGVAPPENYEPGLQLTQVDEIPWFEDTTLANGITSSTWFALGRATDIAVSVPQEAGSSAIVELGKLITEHTPTQ